MSSTKITGVAWFTGRHTIGVVTTESDGETNAYIGVVNGEHELGDTIHIAEWGSKFPVEEATKLISNLGKTVDIEI